MNIVKTLFTVWLCLYGMAVSAAMPVSLFASAPLLKSSAMLLDKDLSKNIATDAPVGTAFTFKQFFHLSASDLQIDRDLPYFSYSIALDSHYADSVYTVALLYPEYRTLTDAELKRYCQQQGIDLKRVSKKELAVKNGLDKLPKAMVRTVVERKQGHLEVVFCPLVYRNGQLQWLTGFMLQVSSAPKAAALHGMRKAQKAASAADRYAQNSVLRQGRWAKIRVPATGIYELTSAVVRKAGFTDASKVSIYGYGGNMQDEVLSEENLIAYDDLKEVPTCNVDGKRLFYAKGPVSWKDNATLKRTRNPYSDYGYYFITESDSVPLSIDSTAFKAMVYPSAEYYHQLHEIDNYAWYEGGRNLFENSPVQAGASKTYLIKHQPGVSSAGKMWVGVTAGSATTYKVSLNGQDASPVSLSFGQYDHGKEGENVFTLDGIHQVDTVVVTTVSGGPTRLDYISVAYTEPRPCPVLKGTTFSAPEYVYNITNQNHHADGAADMVIIIPTSQKLLAQAERLKAYHEQHDSMRVRIVPADELYNEFSSGTPDANAYRRYLKMLYDRAETAADMPSYLVLFGDCVWDNRLNTSECSSLNADDLLLCHESENSFSATDCYVDDCFFCYLDDGEGGDPLTKDKSDVAVGRFPVSNDAQAKVMVDKSISYMENKNAGSWQNEVVFMGDDGNENQHMKDADNMAKLVESINPGFRVKRVMWDAYARSASATGYSYPDVARILKQQQSAGALIMNYSGHGRADQLSHEKVLMLNDFANFTNTNLPLWITASCDIMPFDSQQSTIGETAVLNDKGGAVAFYGTTRTVWTDRNYAINRAYVKALLTPVNGKYRSLGEAQRVAKNELIDTGTDITRNKLQYSLLGDPALVLNVPTCQAVIDSIGGVALSEAEDYPQLNAGTVVKVTGHVNTAGGQLNNSFNGQVSVLVRDAASQITCRLNNTSKEDGASTAFTYTDRDKTLYSGKNQIKDGKFSFNMAVPKDIAYSNSTGLINVFAINSETLETVNGYNADFVVGGTGNLDTDSIGPSIYCYLNSTSFVDGGNVNTTPYFVAEITDKDGINVSTTSIGHEMVLTIDGDMNQTYTLNDNFEFDFGSYTRGTTFYNLPELTPGKHKLRFRAWDVMNNVSTAELTFNVVKNLTPNCLNVSCTKNPAATSTTFVIAHDRPGNWLQVDIDVFDVGGRPVWHHSENGTTGAGTYTVNWDLCGESGGKLSPGIYLYRVKLSGQGTHATSQTRKLIIVSR